MTRTLKKKTPVVSTPETGDYYYDGYQTKRLPSQFTLATEYKRIAYYCSNMNANGVTCTPLRLYMKSTDNQKSVLRKGIDLSPVSDSKKSWLKEQTYLRKTLISPNLDIEEVVDHPLLDLLNKPNQHSDFSFVDLFTLTQLYLELCGKAYWYIPKTISPLIPKQVWLLPSQYVEPVKENEKSKAPIDYFEYTIDTSTGNRSDKFSPEEIIFFKMPSLTDPYKDGMSPLQAAFDDSELNNKLLSTERGLLDNGGRPDFLVSPGKDGAFSPDSARRYEREWKIRFGKGRGGGVYAMDESVDVTPITLPPRDLASLEIAKVSKLEISNAYSVPFVLHHSEKLDRDEREAAEQQHAKHAILPRCGRNAATLNTQLLPKYDPSGRLFLAYDDPVPENKVDLREEVNQGVINGLISVNEGRKRLGYPPFPGEEFNKPRALFDGNNGDNTNNRSKKDQVEGE